MASSSQDTEITLGVGKLLGLFFLLAAICGVFFSIGYSLGRSSGREQAASEQTQMNASADTATAAASAANEDKPAAGVLKTEQAPPSDEPAPPTPENKLTFYKAVQQDSTDTPPAEAHREAALERKSESASEKPGPAVVEAKAAKPTANVISHTSPVTGPGTIVVQIAALSREDDAVSLAGALRKKDYNVFVVNNPVNNDKFYHVQVGPFSTMAEAQAMKAKLVAEGYNPIIKR
jgi:DedD protein